MLLKDPAQRITTQDALKHPFFKILGKNGTMGPPTVFPPPICLDASNEDEEVKEDSEGND